MLDTACNKALETSRWSDVLTWDPEVWALHCIAVESKVQLPFKPETIEKLKAHIIKLIADQTEYQKLHRVNPL